jgi:hypothetical protein
MKQQEHTDQGRKKQVQKQIPPNRRIRPIRDRVFHKHPFFSKAQKIQKNG